MKKISTMLLTMLICVFCISAVYASFPTVTFTPSAPDATLEGKVTAILGVVQWIGFIIGIAMCIWIGIKYLTAGAGQKAEVKSTMIPWLIGAACIALAPTLAASIFNMFKGA